MSSVIWCHSLWFHLVLIERLVVRCSMVVVSVWNKKYNMGAVFVCEVIPFFFSSSLLHLYCIVCPTHYAHTTIDLDITTGLITVGFMRTGSDVPSLQVLSLKWENDWGGLKPVVKDNITTGLWLVPGVSWQPLITAGSNQEPTVIWCYHCLFERRTDGDKISVQNAGTVLSFFLSSILSTEACVWAAPSIVASALHREASSWIWKNGLIFDFVA